MYQTESTRTIFPTEPGPPYISTVPLPSFEVVVSKDLTVRLVQPPDF